jgi:hypothetical protein
MRPAALAIVLALAMPSLAGAQNSDDKSTGLSLDDLGFSKEQTQGSQQDQDILNKRSRMLKIQQILGLVNAGPMLATLYTAPGDRSNKHARDLHAALGITTASLYAATAYFAIKAPKPDGIKDKGPIRVHKALAWVHGIGMVVTPILGSVALDQRDKGQKVHGIASAHGAFAAVTALAYGGAILSVSIKF